MQRPRLEFGTVQSFTGLPDCTVAIELPFINIALPEFIERTPGDPIGPSPWQPLTLAKMEQLTAYLAKQELLVDIVRTALITGLQPLVTSAVIYVRWVPGDPSDYLS